MQLFYNASLNKENTLDQAPKLNLKSLLDQLKKNEFPTQL